MRPPISLFVLLLLSCCCVAQRGRGAEPLPDLSGGLMGNDESDFLRMMDELDRLRIPQPCKTRKLLFRDDFGGGLSRWVVEQLEGGVVKTTGGKLVIDDARGCAVWFERKLRAPVMIQFRATMISDARERNSVRDLNCFWMATEPEAPGGIFANGRRRTGSPGEYRQLRAYFVGRGTANNTATCLLKYSGDGQPGNAPGKVQTAGHFPLRPNKRMKVQLIAFGNTLRYYCNGMFLLGVTDPKPLGEGWFGFQTAGGHIEIDDFRVYSIEPTGDPEIDAGLNWRLSGTDNNFAFKLKADGQPGGELRQLDGSDGKGGLLGWRTESGGSRVGSDPSGGRDISSVYLAAGQDVYQILADPLQTGDRYTFSFRAALGSAAARIKGSLVYADGFDGRPIAALAAITARPADGLKTHTLAFTAESGQPYIGKHLGIRAANPGTGHARLEHVSVSGPPRRLAYQPRPVKNGLEVALAPTLTWKPGDYAGKHEVYLGTDREALAAASKEDLLGIYRGTVYECSYTVPDELARGTVYYWRVDAVVAGDPPRVDRGNVWSFTTTEPRMASHPLPRSGGLGAPTRPTLAWTPGKETKAHHVYFGADKAAVTAAEDPHTPPGRGVRKDASYAPEGLALSTTYYWRVDEHDGEKIHRGKLWSLTTSKSAVASRLNGGRPIITREMGGGSGPSLIRIPDWIDPQDRTDPKAVYYLYFAHRRHRHIRLAWAENIEGPYTIYNPGEGVLRPDIRRGGLTVGGHLGSPDVHVDHQNRRIVMYFHGNARWEGVRRAPNGTHSTCVATSPRGLDFNGGVEEAILGQFCFRVFKHQGNLYAMAHLGRIYRARNPEAPFNNDPSGDGAAVDISKDYLWEESETVPFTGRLGHTGFTGMPRRCAVYVEGDTLQVYYSRYGDRPERIVHSTIDLSGDFHKWTALKADEVLEPELKWEGADLPLTRSGTDSGNGVRRLRDPACFRDADGRRYLLYTANGGTGIGIARFNDDK